MSERMTPEQIATARAAIEEAANWMLRDEYSTLAGHAAGILAELDAVTQENAYLRRLAAGAFREIDGMGELLAEKDGGA